MRIWQTQQQRWYTPIIQFYAEAHNQNAKWIQMGNREWNIERLCGQNMPKTHLTCSSAFGAASQGLNFLSAFFNPVVWLVTSSVPSLQHCSLHHEPPDAPRRCESRCKMTWKNSLANNNATLVTTCGKKLRQTLTTIHMWAITHILCHTL